MGMHMQVYVTGQHYMTWHVACHAHNETPGWIGLGLGMLSVGLGMSHNTGDEN